MAQSDTFNEVLFIDNDDTNVTHNNADQNQANSNLNIDDHPYLHLVHGILKNIMEDEDIKNSIDNLIIDLKDIIYKVYKNINIRHNNHKMIFIKQKLSRYIMLQSKIINLSDYLKLLSGFIDSEYTDVNKECDYIESEMNHIVKDIELLHQIAF